VGVFFGNPETTPGGMALKFYSSVRVEVRRSAQIKMGERVVGNRVNTKVVKNKVAPPFTACQFDIMYKEGISLSGDLIDMGTEYEVIKKSGNSYTFGEEKLGVGRESAKSFLHDNAKISNQIKKEIWQKVMDRRKEEK
jgi:recombination protein RecA